MTPCECLNRINRHIETLEGLRDRAAKRHHYNIYNLCAKRIEGMRYARMIITKEAI